MSWANDINKLTTKGGRDLNTLMKVVKIKLFTGIIILTRVDTGRLRGNWQMQEGVPATGAINRLDKTGSIVIGQVVKASPDGVTYFTNNLPYAKLYEVKDAMVGRTVTLLKGIVKDEAAKL